jgi:hypothetical protein
MSEWRQYRNPWAEKLSQVSLPDGGGSWKAMEAILDREMPAGRRRHWRRWVLLILLLLLLIGVCNCPGRKWFLSGKREVTKTEAGKPETDKTGQGSFRDVPAGGKAQGGPSVGGAVPGPKTGESASVPEQKAKTGDSVSVPERNAVTGDSASVPERKATRTRDAAPVPVMGVKIPALKELKPKPGTKAKQWTRDRVTNGGQGENDSVAVTSGVTPTKPTGKTVTTPPATTVTTPPVKTAPKNAAKMPPTPPTQRKDEDKKEKQNGWMVGIGLNQFFTVGGQQASSFNSGGITGTLGDYIPVPMVRYYFNPKLYVQLEAQINTPQYTKKNLVAVSTPVDSIGTTTGGATVTLQQSVAINKLFYFNLPLSMHYTVFDHLDLGAGLQYSRLTNGIGVFNSNYGQNGVDTLETTETKSFKGDSVYQEIKTHEFRFLVDANYTWRHFIFGLRYNQALSKFIHVEISPGQITQARNSSLQLYLRYILWDGRKKKPLLPAK